VDFAEKDRTGAKRVPAPWQTTINKQTEHHILWYGIFPLASLGCLPGCAPSQFLHTCALAEHGKLKKKSVIS